MTAVIGILGLLTLLSAAMWLGWRNVGTQVQQFERLQDSANEGLL